MINNDINENEMYNQDRRFVKILARCVWREVISMKTGGMKMQIDEIKDQFVMCVTKCGSWAGLQQTMEM